MFRPNNYLIFKTLKKSNIYTPPTHIHHHTLIQSFYWNVWPDLGLLSQTVFNIG